MGESRFTRREFLGVAVAASASGALLGCGEKAAQQLIPYVIPPDDVIPGESRYYRTVCRACPAGCGLMVRTREGRVVKLEGNPEHPVNGAALCVRGQAAIEGLYDPDRLRGPLLRTAAGLREASWEEAEAMFTQLLGETLASGRLVVVATRPEPGAMGEMLRSWLQALGQKPEQIVVFEPTEPRWMPAGRQAAFGVADTPVYEIGRARLLLSIGFDFLEEGPSPVEHARGLAEMRARTRGERGRFVYVGPRLSMTAAAADEWIAPRPGSELALVLGLAHLAIDLGGAELPAMSAAIAKLRDSLAPFGPELVARRTGLPVRELNRLADDFVRLRPSLCLGPGRVVAGRNAAELAAAMCVLNAIAGSVGDTIRFLGSPSAEPSGWTTEDLLREAEGGRVGVLVCHHADPLGRGGTRASRAWSQIGSVVVLGNWLDETATAAQLVLPDHHFLEAWGEVSSRAGVRGTQQPSMAPLHDTRAAGDVLLAVARRLGRTEGLPDGDFASWIRSKFADADLERGGVFVEPAMRAVALVDQPLASSVLAKPRLEEPERTPTLVLFPSTKKPAGQPRERLLQEVPDPVTTIAWTGWAELAPDTAGKLDLVTGDVIRLDTPHGSVELPCYVHPGLRNDIVAVPAPFAANLGGDAGADRSLGLVTGVRVVRTARRVILPRAEGSSSQHGRALAREVAGGAPLLPRPEHARRSMYPKHDHPKHRWGLVVDLDRCNGCSACVAACHVENNIAVVGAVEVRRGREMGWLRVDRFIENGSGAPPRMRFVPVMCQQCCNAPCEAVCPVYTTYHNAEGLNAQIYNRCIGTRYCENNCPYAARRFNWWDYPRPWPTNLGLNPDVTVRERGVVEKCTFCFQRIREAAERAKMEGREVHDGEIAPACVQTCPAGALVFGDLADPDSRVSQLAKDGRAYRLMEHLNTEPGVYYLARIRKEGLP